MPLLTPSNASKPCVCTLKQLILSGIKHNAKMQRDCSFGLLCSRHRCLATGISKYLQIYLCGFLQYDCSRSRSKAFCCCIAIELQCACNSFWSCQPCKNLIKSRLLFGMRIPWLWIPSAFLDQMAVYRFIRQMSATFPTSSWSIDCFAWIKGFRFLSSRSACQYLQGGGACVKLSGSTASPGMRLW